MIHRLQMQVIVRYVTILGVIYCFMNCGAVHAPNCIVQQYPWFSLVEFNSIGVQVQCAGAVINESYVLTAASCFREAVDTVATVTAGVVKNHLCENFRQTVVVYLIKSNILVVGETLVAVCIHYTYSYV